MARQTHQERRPKAYKWLDSRIQEDVIDRFTDDPWFDATLIDVSVQDTEVTLVGTAGGRDDRRPAERLAEHISGVAHVQSKLRVDTGTYSKGDKTQDPVWLKPSIRHTIGRRTAGANGCRPQSAPLFGGTARAYPHDEGGPATDRLFSRTRG